MRLRGALCAFLVLCLGSAGLWAGTDGLRAFTSEQARRLAVQRTPRPVPHAVLQDQDGRSFSLDDYRGRKLLVDFVYTRCRSICGALGAGFQRLSQDLAPAPDATMLVTISFDPQADTPAALMRYAQRYGADSRVWRIARPQDEATLAALLRTFEVVVVRNAYGEYQHNAALHLVDESGRLTRIFGYDELERAAEALER
jgi:protein SCO1/2